MITNNRVFEKKKFLDTLNSNDRFKQCDYFCMFSRQGLYAYLKDLDYKSVLLPSYVAEGVIDPFKKLGYKILFYDVDANGYVIPKSLEQRVDVFVYIHYYGLYNEKNLKIIEQYRSNFSLFIEDYAHVVFDKNIELNGDICLFSFTKIFGVIDGSCILFNKTNPKSAIYLKNKSVTRKLRTSLYLEKIFLSYCGFLKNSKNIYVVARRIFSMNWFWYPLLMSSYDYNYPQMSSRSFQTLLHLKMDSIIQTRKKYARLYLSHLHPALLFDVPKQYYEKHGLFAFPIKLLQRDDFLKVLTKKGVGAFTLTGKWWFNEQGNKDLYSLHILLPINHYLKEHEIMTVIEQVNCAYESFQGTK